MKSQWPIWVFILGVIAIVLFAFNYRGNEELVSLSEIFPEEDISKLPDIEYDFVNGEDSAVEGQASEQVAQAPAVANAPTVDIGVGQEPVATTASADVEQAAAPTEAAAKAAPVAAAKATTQSATQTARAEFNNPAFTIQVASAKDKEAAERQLKTVQAAGHPAYLVRKDLGDKGVWYRIYVGQFNSKSAANEYLSKVKGTYRDSFIISPK